MRNHATHGDMSIDIQAIAFINDEGEQLKQSGKSGTITMG